MTPIYAVLALLFPLGIYSLFLAEINRRSAPVLVPGSWDTVGLLFASSGFFLGSAPLLFDEFWFRHWLIWAVYYVLLAAGSVFLIWWRSSKTMVYNVDPERFLQRLHSTITLMGLSAAVEGGVKLVVTPAKDAPITEGTDFMETLPMRPPLNPHDRRHAELEVETFPSLCHVTLHWGRCAPGVRGEIEKELAKGLDSAVSEDNPVAGWMLSISGLIFGVLAMVVAATCLAGARSRGWL